MTRVSIGKILLTSPIVINVPTRASLAVETKDLLFLWLAYLNKAMFVNRYLPYGKKLLGMSENTTTSAIQLHGNVRGNTVLQSKYI